MSPPTVHDWPYGPPPCTIRKAAEMLGVHEDTIRAAIRRGDITTTPKVGRSYLIPADEMRRLLSAAEDERAAS